MKAFILLALLVSFVLPAAATPDYSKSRRFKADNHFPLSGEETEESITRTFTGYFHGEKWHVYRVFNNDNDYIIDCNGEQPSITMLPHYVEYYAFDSKEDCERVISGALEGGVKVKASKADKRIIEITEL